MNTPPKTPTTQSGTTPNKPAFRESLLDTYMRSPLDPGYAKAAKETAPRKPSWTVASALLMTLVGLALSVAIIQLRDNDQDISAQLASQVAERRKELDNLQDHVRALRNSNDRDRQAITGADTDRSQQLTARAGYTPQQGDAFTITITDAPGSDSAETRVVDTDLQVIVNALWAAGAQSIDVDGHRLTTTTAIRDAGQAILVAYTPITSPYTVSAVGDVDALRRSWGTSLAAKHLAYLNATYAIESDTATVTDYTAPAADEYSLNHAGVIDSTP